MLRRLDVMHQGPAAVITTTHEQNLERLVGPTDAIEIIGTPYDLGGHRGREAGDGRPGEGRQPDGV